VAASFTLSGIVAFSFGAGAASAVADKPPIVVGGDGDLASAAGAAQGFEAGISRFNQAGGLDGRRIKFVGFLDDDYSAQTNLTDAQQLVENKHVSVVAPFLSEIGTAATGQFLAVSKTPFIGWAVSSAFATAPSWGYGVNGNQTNPQAVVLAGVQQLLKVTGNTTTPWRIKVAGIAENVSAGVSALNGAVAAYKYLGAKVVYHKAPIAVLGTTTYTPYAQAIVASGANVAFEVLDSADAVGLAAALKADGFNGLIYNGVTYFPGQLASHPNEAEALNGALVENEFPADENNTPAVNQAKKDLESIGQPPQLTNGVSVGYWSAILLEQMLKATLAKVGGNPMKVNGATIHSMVNSGFTYKDPIAGGIGPMYFPAAESIPTGCLTTLKVVGTTYKQLVPYNCASGVLNLATYKRYHPKTGR
jgi:ABC-type branched-subunit amino acid transport system substrate-binding protein